MSIGSMVNVKHQNSEITKKIKIVMMNIDNDYDALKNNYCHVEGVRHQDIKDTRR